MTDVATLPKPVPTVYVADDDAGLLASFGALFEADRLAHQLFASGDDLLEGLQGEHAGCVILDYSMPGRNGLETIAALRAAGIGLPVIMITAHGDIELAVQAMKAGAYDFIEKPWDKDALLNAIRRAMRQDAEKRDLLEGRRKAVEAIASFTPRERQVFDQLVKGAANKVIARALDLSPRTVEFYRANVLEKAGVTSVAGLVRLAFLARTLKA